MGKTRRILLSFDVEEFDTPLEYGMEVSLTDQMNVGYRGLEAIEQVLEATGITTTLFTTAHFAEHYSEKIKSLSSHHEIASHTFYHSKFEKEDLLKSKLALEVVCGKPVVGLRMPRMKAIGEGDIAAAGYQYDSSVNPTWVPGRYNNLRFPRTAYARSSFIEVPATVSPNFRIPLFWLLFKNIPYELYKHLAIRSLKSYGYLCLYFHPWEFTALHTFDALPNYVKRHSGEVLVNRLFQLIKDLEKQGEFDTMQNFVQTLPIKKA